MGRKLYVGNLAYSVTDDGLKELFSQAGTVASATVIMDKFTGRSRGFGFVEMATDEEAQAAVQKLNGYSLNERALVVNEARPLEEKRERTSRFGGGGGGGRFGPRRDRGPRREY